MSVPAAEGEMTVLGGHMPLITTLKQGNIVVRLAAAQGSGEAKEKIFPIRSGILEVRRDGATVIL